MKSNEPSRPHVELITLLIRVLGVFFIVEGVICIVANGLGAVWYYEQYGSEFLQETAFMPAREISWVVGGVLYVVLGVCLIFKGSMALDAIYHDAPDDEGE